jgi:diphosphomevalonate decarboxylase
MSTQATAVAHPNIALVKYWGKRDRALNLPATSSLSVTLDRFETRTTVSWGVENDEVVLDGQRVTGKPARRVLDFLDLVDEDRPNVRVVSASNFPVAAGLASSSSAFSALALAASAAAGQALEPAALSVLARRGSGSACRSLWGGFVHWTRGERADGLDCHGHPIALAEPWELRVVVAVVHAGPKAVGSTEGMVRTRDTSPVFPVFVAENEGLVREAHRAVLARDLDRLIVCMERSTTLMHASMLTAVPSVRYLKPGSLAVLDAVDALRGAGVPCGWTMDAGPNVKVLCRAQDAPAVERAIAPIVHAVHVLGPGGPARLVGEGA